jgi:hypothetical protein
MSDSRRRLGAAGTFLDLQMTRPPLSPFTEKTAPIKARAAEDLE